MDIFKGYIKEWVVGGLVLANMFVFIALWQRRPTDTLRVWFIDVGQGDAILVDSPTHHRLLIDGGPDRSVLSALGRILPFGDRDIDVVIESHPDKDHIAGLPEVVSRYAVGALLEPGVESKNTIDDELHARVEAEDVPDVLARRNMVVDLGDGAELLVLYPDRDVSTWDTNDASIVAKLIYGNRSFLLTGDSTKKAEFALLALDPDLLQADVLKVGHHGSKNSTSLTYAKAVSPAYAVISAGTNNDYGHPHQETINTLDTVGAEIVSTEDTFYTRGRGTIEFQTNGQKLVLK